MSKMFSPILAMILYLFSKRVKGRQKHRHNNATITIMIMYMLTIL